MKRRFEVNGDQLVDCWQDENGGKSCQTLPLSLVQRGGARAQLGSAPGPDVVARLLNDLGKSEFPRVDYGRYAHDARVAGALVDLLSRLPYGACVALVAETVGRLGGAGACAVLSSRLDEARAGLDSTPEHEHHGMIGSAVGAALLCLDPQSERAASMLRQVLQVAAVGVASFAARQCGECYRDRLRTHAMLEIGRCLADVATAPQPVFVAGVRGALCAHPSLALPRVNEMLQLSSREALRVQLVRQLVASGSIECISAAIAHLAIETSPRVRLTIVSTTLKILDPSLVEHEIGAALRHEAPSVRLEAAWLLGRSRSTGVKVPVENVDEPDEYVAAAIFRALEVDTDALG